MYALVLSSFISSTQERSKKGTKLTLMRERGAAPSFNRLLLCALRLPHPKLKRLRGLEGEVQNSLTQGGRQPFLLRRLRNTGMSCPLNVWTGVRRIRLVIHFWTISTRLCCNKNEINKVFPYYHTTVIGDFLVCTTMTTMTITHD